MKFDCIVMNPPYQRNLHLKILEEAVKHLKDDGCCVNLSPDAWLVDPFKMYSKEKTKKDATTSVGQRILQHESFSKDEFNQQFGTSSHFGVGLFVLSPKTTGFDCNKWNSTNALLLKVLEKTYKMPSLRSKFSRRIDDPRFVPVRRRTHKTYSYCELDDTVIKAREGIMFASKQEAYNFKKSVLQTWLYKWLDTTEWEGSENSAEVPFFGDVINSRTKLKGYTGEWTDDDFYKYFEINENEKKAIEAAIAKS